MRRTSNSNPANRSNPFADADPANRGHSVNGAHSASPQHCTGDGALPVLRRPGLKKLSALFGCCFSASPDHPENRHADLNQKLMIWAENAPHEELAYRRVAASRIEMNSREQLPVLNLEGLQLSTLPGCLADLTWVENLNVQRNRLTELPSALPIALKNLNVSFNSLDHLPVLPPTLTKLDAGKNNLTVLGRLPENLTHLDVNHNSLYALPEIPEVLRSLDISYNQLRRLPATFEASMRAGNLNISFNQWLPEEIARISRFPFSINVTFTDRPPPAPRPPPPRQNTDAAGSQQAQPPGGPPPPPRPPPPPPQSYTQYYVQKVFELVRRLINCILQLFGRFTPTRAAHAAPQTANAQPQATYHGSPIRIQRRSNEEWAYIVQNMRSNGLTKEAIEMWIADFDAYIKHSSFDPLIFNEKYRLLVNGDVEESSLRRHFAGLRNAFSNSVKIPQ